MQSQSSRKHPDGGRGRRKLGKKGGKKDGHASSPSISLSMAPSPSTGSELVQDVTSEASLSSEIAGLYIFEDGAVCVDIRIDNLTRDIVEIAIYFGDPGDEGSIDLVFHDFVEDDPVPVESGEFVALCVEHTDEVAILDYSMSPEQYFINLSTQDNLFGEVRGQLR